MADIDLDRLEALLAKSTPGPWGFVEGHEFERVIKSPDRREIAIMLPSVVWPGRDHDDGEIVIALRNAAPELLRRARELERFREMLFQMSHDESHGCVTGDCPHDSVQECVKDLSELLKERASESRSALDQSKE